MNQDARIGPGIFVGLPQTCLNIDRHLGIKVRQVAQPTLRKTTQHTISNSTELTFGYPTKTTSYYLTGGQRRVDPNNVTIDYDETGAPTHNVLRQLQAISLDKLFSAFPFTERIIEKYDSNMHEPNRYYYTIFVYLVLGKEKSCFEYIVDYRIRVQIDSDKVRSYNPKISVNELRLIKQSEIGKLLVIYECAKIVPNIISYTLYQGGPLTPLDLQFYTVILGDPTQDQPGISLRRNRRIRYRGFSDFSLFRIIDRYHYRKWQRSNNQDHNGPFLITRHSCEALPFEITKVKQLPEVILLPNCTDNWKLVNYLGREKQYEWKDGRNIIDLSLLLSELINVSSRPGFRRTPRDRALIAGYFNHLLVLNKDKGDKFANNTNRYLRKFYFSKQHPVRDIIEERIKRLQFPSESEKGTLYYEVRH